jgi:RNA polymerase sigma factor (sigma-70 family)
MPLNLTSVCHDKLHESRELSANPATSDEVLIGRIANGDRLAMQVLDEETAEAIEDTSDTPDVTLEKKQKADVIRKCLGGLSAEHREIIDLVYYHEKSVEEVAEIVGIPEATVKTRMFYARKKLAELLKAQGIERGWP